MARPQKIALDYFPLECHDDDNLRFIEAKYGVRGFGLIVKLWSKVYSSEGYYCQWNEKAKCLFSHDRKVSSTFLDEVLETCFSEGIFDKELYDKFQILSSREIQLVYFKVIGECRRKGIAVRREYDLLGVSSEETPVNNEETMVNVGVNPEETRVNSACSTQIKEKKKKGNNSKEKGEKEPPPFQEDHKVAFSEKPKREADKEKEEKGSEQKEEKGNEGALADSCQAYFLTVAKGYFWEQKDNYALDNLLLKIRSSLISATDVELEKGFQAFITHLPHYWRSKKFTLSLLNLHYNEIITEILFQQTHDANTTGNTKFGRHATDDLAVFAASFGR
ncbi:MAG: DUF4373 domain-containing protein [Colwellia sp.]|nr:DUF4373 domain-containing protein [Colwellia sp.]